MEMLTREQFEQLEQVRENARNDDTPYIGIVDNTINVNGNPNKTEIKPADYTVHFIFPDNELFRTRIKTTGDKILGSEDGYIWVERTYKGVYITPRRMPDATTTGAIIEQFINTVSEDGKELKSLSYEQIVDIMSVDYKQVQNAVFDLVSTVLDISEAEAEWLAPIDTLSVALQIALNNPAFVNGTDFFTVPSFLKGQKKSE